MAGSRTPPAVLCPNCGVAGNGRFCAECGAAYADAKENPYAFLADSFFELGDMKKYVSLYWRLLSSPTMNTIKAFEAGRLIDGVRFLKYSLGLYVVALAVSGFDKIFGNNELLKTISEPVEYFLTYVVTFTLYYFAMRRKATIQRTKHEFILFTCLTVGFMLPSGTSALVPVVGWLIGFALLVPLCLYQARTWKYFWGVSGKRAFWTLMGCTAAGTAAGDVVLAVIWAVSGRPDFTSLVAPWIPS